MNDRARAAYEAWFAPGKPPMDFEMLFDDAKADWAQSAEAAAGVALNAAAGDVSEAKDGSFEDLVETLRRIANATPFNTNSASADQMASWCQVVAQCALSRAALLAASKVRENSRGEAPAGWQTVPEEPTIEMRAAAHQCFVDAGFILNERFDLELNIWCDMLAAAPPPALRSAPAEQDGGWLPIDAKAKNGEIWLLAWDVGEPDGFYCTEGWYEAGPADRRFYSIQSEEIRPTHYRARLPAPPRSLASGSDGEHRA